MPIEFDESMQQRLKQAEMAERELARLQPLAEEAEDLRVKKGRAAKFEDSLRRREQSLTEAKQMIEAASIRQVEIPALLDNASQAVAALFAAMKDVNTRRRRPPRPWPSSTGSTTTSKWKRSARNSGSMTATPGA